MNSSGRDIFKATEEVLLLLERSKQRVDHSIDILPGIYLVLDSKGLILRKNNELRRLLEEGFNNLLGKSIWDFVDDSSRQALESQMKLAQSQLEKSFYCEIRLQTRKSGGLDYSLTLFAWELKERSENQIFYTLHGKDVTDLRRVSREKQELQREIKGAEQLQKVMVPETCLETKDFKLSCYYRAASDCGGDFLYYRHDKNKLRLWAGDVTGHGVGSAMVSGAARAAVSIIEQKSETTPLEALKALNACIVDVTRNSYWMTFQIVDFDFSKKKIELCNAGHEEVFWLEDPLNKKNTWKDFQFLDSRPSTPLGRGLDSNYEINEFPLNRNCLYFCASDGIPETKDSEGRVYNNRRMLKTLLRAYQEMANLEQAQKILLEEVAHFREYRPMEDDISLWALMID